MSFKSRNEELNQAAGPGEVDPNEPPLQVCGHCGQTFDARLLGEVHHHLQPQHNRL